MPTIRLGHVEVSRLILGSNPFFGYAHQDGDLGRQMQEYYTDQRIMEVLDEAAALGVTAVAAPPMPGMDPDSQQVSRPGRQIDHLDRPAAWIAEEDEGGNRHLRQGGAKAVFIQGHRVEEQFEKKTFDVVRGWLEHIKSHGMAAGMASHRPDIHPVAEKLGFPTDFYFQCFFRVDQHPENYALECRDHAVETIRSITAKPVVAYKILGAARLAAGRGLHLCLPAHRGQGRRLRRHLQQEQAGHAGRRRGTDAAGNAILDQGSHMKSDSAIVGAAHAAGSDTIRLALVGCGNRGSGACRDALSTPGPVQLVAMGDLFANRLETSLKNLQRHDELRPRIDVPPERRFVGFDAYEKVLEAGVDLVLFATPPHFRPIHYAAAVKAGKHVFLEKPCCVDAPGYRMLLAANETAKAKRLIGRGRLAAPASAALSGEDQKDPRRRRRRDTAHSDLFQYARRRERACPSRPR